MCLSLFLEAWITSVHRTKITALINPYRRDQGTPCGLITRVDAFSVVIVVW